MVAAVVVGLYSAVGLYFGPFYPPAGPVAAVYSGPGFADSAAGLSASFAPRPNYNVFHHLSGYYVMTAYMLLPLCHNLSVIENHSHIMIDLR